MSDDWKPGDLALCVLGGPARCFQGRLENTHGTQTARGALYTVRKVSPSPYLPDALGVFVDGIDGGWFPDRFRKIKPLTDEEREQFTANLNTREPANA